MSKSNSDIKFVFFGSQPAGRQGSRFSEHVLGALREAGLEPALNITSARDPLPMNKLSELEADVFIVASFGKILPAELIYMPKHKTLNVHPSLLPRLRGPAPIQNTILLDEESGVSIMRMDEKMDHGPILAQEKVPISPWPDYYETVEEKLGIAGGELLAQVLPDWISGKIQEKEQDHDQATYTKIIKKEDGLLNLSSPAQKNLRKVYAYHSWPGAYFFHKRSDGPTSLKLRGASKEIRIVVRKAELENCNNENSLKIVNCKLKIVSIVPAGKKEMPWQDFLRGNK